MNKHCKTCGLDISNQSPDVWSKKLIESGLCLMCFRIEESERDPESTKHLDIEKMKIEQAKQITKIESPAV